MLLIIALSLLYVELKESVIRSLVSDIIKEYLNVWELRSLLLFSLIFQCFLLRAGNRRRLYRGRWLPIMELWVWSVYLLADWMAVVVLSSFVRGEVSPEDELVFWTSFILWHLGGPYNITAYNFEDNSLWLRRLIFGLFYQVGVAVYVCIKFHSPDTTLNLAAIPVFVAGVVRYGERIWALWSASPYKLRDYLTKKQDIGEETGIIRTAVRVDYRTIKRYLGDVPEADKFVLEAHLSSVIHQPLFTRLPFRVAKELHDDMVFIESKSPDEAFRLVGAELHFFYDLLYTKIPLHVSHHRLSLGLRIFCFSSAVSFLIAYAVSHYHLVHRKRNKEYPDMAVTYLLLVGAMALEAHSFFVDARAMTWTRITLPIPFKWVSHVLKSKRSKRRIKRMGQHDLLDYYIKVRANRLSKLLIRFSYCNYLMMFWYSQWHPIDSDLKQFIFSHLHKKRDKCKEQKFSLEFVSKLLDEFKGGEVFRNMCEEKGLPSAEDYLQMDTRDFTSCVFLWHITTGLVYFDDVINHRRDIGGKACKIGKALSDYMMYLVVARPLMLPPGFTDATNLDTYKQCGQFFLDKMIRNFSTIQAKKRFTLGLLGYDLKEEALYHAKNRENFSQLFKGCDAAKRMQNLVRGERWDHEEKWEFISEVWMEMMTYAASYCSWEQHAKELTRGGELLTLVSLLMTHLGLNTQIRIDEKVEPAEASIFSNGPLFPSV